MLNSFLIFCMPFPNQFYHLALCFMRALRGTLHHVWHLNTAVSMAHVHKCCHGFCEELQSATKTLCWQARPVPNLHRRLRRRASFFWRRVGVGVAFCLSEDVCDLLDGRARTTLGQDGCGERVGGARLREAARCGTCRRDCVAGRIQQGG